MNTSDRALIAAVRERHDRTAYGELYRRHLDAARAAAYRIAPRIDRDDIISEAFTRILQTIENGAGPREAFRPYLYQVIRNVSIDMSSVTAARNETSIDDVDLVHPRSLDDLADILADQSIVAEALTALPERWQAVLWYTEVEGFTPRETAELLGLSANNVSQIRHRARKRFRSIVDGGEGALGRAILVVVLGASTASCLFPLVDRGSSAAAATQGAGSVASHKTALLVGSAASLTAAVVLVALLSSDAPSSAPGPPTHSEAVAAAEGGRESRPDDREEEETESRNGDRGSSGHATTGESAIPVDPGPWETLPQEEPVVRGPSRP
ncbi:RNA polymerase sigma factor [Leucobacter ruminantium]|uniref:Sigma-70 family RNA polymerase sigma factor n=1 Tax=Leucobacter ruminantium TaxID=1289170 RepID=A0A939LXM0_9MICO|nr:sigma-70 family RNA polymerase sigma factor [Leucobacter ruminantium]MBO1804808.1 sigma-70 family RNA polymerase sigma factor [Leucobacter ruminantium]